MSAPAALGRNGLATLPTWEELEAAAPQVVETMGRYLQQIGCILRPGSVNNTAMALRAFAGFLVEAAPEVLSVAAVTRAHIENYKPWLAARPGQNKARVTTATIAHRLGTLRMFFVRIDEWGWDEAPPKVPMFPGDLPRQDQPLPKALDDAAAARLLRAARNDERLLVRVTVEVLLRTGLRVSEFTALPADAVVMFGEVPWLHVPVGKLRDDRYLPLHPDLVDLIDRYRELGGRELPAQERKRTLPSIPRIPYCAMPSTRSRGYRRWHAGLGPVSALGRSQSSWRRMASRI